MPLFHNFYPKIDSNAYFDTVFSNFEQFNRKTINAVQFSITKIKNSVNLMHLRSKVTLEIRPKAGNLDGKKMRNRLKASTLPPFSQKTAVFIEKR